MEQKFKHRNNKRKVAKSKQKKLLIESDNQQQSTVLQTHKMPCCCFWARVSSTNIKMGNTCQNRIMQVSVPK